MTGFQAVVERAQVSFAPIDAVRQKRLLTDTLRKCPHPRGSPGASSRCVFGCASLFIGDRFSPFLASLNECQQIGLGNTIPALPDGKGWQFLLPIPNGLPRPFRRRRKPNEIIHIYLFQSRTGFPGHLDYHSITAWRELREFQSRTGFPGHLDVKRILAKTSTFQGFNPERASQAI